MWGAGKHRRPGRRASGGKRTPQGPRRVRERNRLFSRRGGGRRQPPRRLHARNRQSCRQHAGIPAESRRRKGSVDPPSLPASVTPPSPPPSPFLQPSPPPHSLPQKENKAACANAEATSDSNWYMWTPPPPSLPGGPPLLPPHSLPQNKIQRPAPTQMWGGSLTATRVGVDILARRQVRAKRGKGGGVTGGGKG